MGNGDCARVADYATPPERLREVVLAQTVKERRTVAVLRKARVGGRGRLSNTPEAGMTRNKAIAHLMHFRGFTPARVARRAHVSRSHLNNMLVGRYAVSDEMAERLSEILGAVPELILELPTVKEKRSNGTKT